MIEEMYQENILEHYKNPSNFGKLESHTHSARELNPLCGDDVSIFLDVKNDIVDNVSFVGNGCAISRASCSMLTEKIKGMKMEDVRKISKEDVFDMLGIRISHARMKCALIGLSTLLQAANQNSK